MKLCKNCIWYKEREPEPATCLSPHLGVTPVHGTPITNYCLTERRDGRCGPKGKYFATSEENINTLTNQVNALKLIVVIIVLAYIGKLTGLY